MSSSIGGGIPQGLNVSAPGTIAALTTGSEKKAQELDAAQDQSKASLADELVEDGASLVVTVRNLEKSKVAEKVDKKQEIKGAGEVIPIAAVEEKAGEFSKKNPEYLPTFLVALSQKIKTGDKSSTILKEVIASCGQDAKITDPYLIQVALEFLKEVTTGDLQTEVQKAIDEFSADPKNKQSIAAGENITAVARKASEESAQTTNELLTLYQDVTKNSRDSVTLFFELKTKYPNPKERKLAIAFLLKALGAEKETKTPSIEHAKLADIINEIGSIRSAGKVEEFFEKRNAFIDTMFAAIGRE